MELQQVLNWLFELQQLTSRKAELVLEIAQKYSLDRSSDRSRDLSLHVRDRHQGYFDIESDLKWRREGEEEMEKLRAQYREVCEKIKMLQAKLENEISTPAAA